MSKTTGAVTRKYLEEIAAKLHETRQQDLQAALDRQNVSLEKLFDAKLATVTHAVATQTDTLTRHTLDDSVNFRTINEAVNKINDGLTVTKLKVAGIIFLITTLAGGVGAYVSKHVGSSVQIVP